MIKTSLKWSGIILVVFACLFGSFQLLKDWKFNSDAPLASFTAPNSLSEARHQDLEQLALFFDLEKSWTLESLDRAKAEWQSLTTTAEQMTDAEFELGVAKIVALAGNAHSKIREYNRTPRYNRLPIRSYWFSDGYHVIRAYKGFEKLLGYKLIEIEGQPVDQITRELEQYIAGPEGTVRKYMPYLLESPELLHAAGLIQFPQQMEVTFEVTGEAIGPERTTVVFADPFPPSTDQMARTHYLLTPDVYAQSQPDWSPLKSGSEATPIYLQLPAERMQMRSIPDMEASYVQFWTNNNVGSTSIQAFCNETLATYRKNPSRYLIVDQRFNGGGNFNLTQSCMEEFGQSIPEDGFLYIIIGGTTFSAGMYSTAFLMQSAGDKAVLVGEKVGDTLQSWGEDNLLKLPNSEIVIKFSTGMHDLSKPCSEWTKCHWDALFLDLNITSMAPDIYAPLHYEDFLNNRDTALEAIREHQQSLLTQ
jgi:hypothetical protein